MHNFGKLKHNIYEVVSEGIASKDVKKKQILKKFITMLKENEILKTQAIVYQNLEERVDDDALTASDYVKENISLLQRYNISDIVRENKKLAILLEGYDLVDSYEGEELHENIHKLITTEKNPQTLNSLMESTTFVKKHILNNQPKKKVVKENYVPNSMLGHILNKKFSEKYANLSETEVKILKSVATNNVEEQTDVFESTKKATISKINDLLKESTNVEVKGKLLDVKERLLDTKYVSESFVTDMVKIIKLQENLNG